jgi:hypothetical protein
MDTVLKKFLWKKNLTGPNPKIFYIYGGVILVFKGIFFQDLNQNICPPVIPTKTIKNEGKVGGTFWVEGHFMYKLTFLMPNDLNLND